MISIQETLDLQSPLADTVGLVPMNLSSPNRAIYKSNGSIAFEFSPTLPAMSLP